MGKIAIVFPGQGSQKLGMGQRAYQSSAAAKAIFDEADAALGESLSTLCFEGPIEALGLTANTQPALVTTSIALLRGLQEHSSFDFAMCAGHSLGEYSALVAAGALSFSDAVRLVRKRGQFMQEAVPVGEGAMAAIMKASPEDVLSVCQSVDGICEPANYNSPGQIVIAGAKDAVANASAQLKEKGAKAIPLSVSAPFHCQMMMPAQKQLGPELDATAFGDLQVPVMVNVDAALVQNADAAKDALRRQVSGAVKWQQSIEKMVEEGITLFVEIGPGKVLTGLIRRIAKDLERVNVSSFDDFEAASALIAAHTTE